MTNTPLAEGEMTKERLEELGLLLAPVSLTEMPRSIGDQWSIARELWRHSITLLARLEAAERENSALSFDNSELRTAQATAERERDEAYTDLQAYIDLLEARQARISEQENALALADKCLSWIMESDVIQRSHDEPPEDGPYAMAASEALSGIATLQQETKP